MINLTNSLVLLGPEEPESSFTEAFCRLNTKNVAIDKATKNIPTSNNPPSVRFNGIADGGAGAGVLIMFQPNDKVFIANHFGVQNSVLNIDIYILFLVCLRQCKQLQGL